MCVLCTVYVCAMYSVCVLCTVCVCYVQNVCAIYSMCVLCICVYNMYNAALERVCNSIGTHVHAIKCLVQCSTYSCLPAQVCGYVCL